MRCQARSKFCWRFLWMKSQRKTWQSPINKLVSLFSPFTTSTLKHSRSRNQKKMLTKSSKTTEIKIRKLIKFSRFFIPWVKHHGRICCTYISTANLGTPNTRWNTTTSFRNKYARQHDPLPSDVDDSRFLWLAPHLGSEHTTHPWRPLSLRQRS